MSDQNQPPADPNQPKPPETAPEPARPKGLIAQVGGRASEIIHREATIPEKFFKKRDRSRD